MVGSNPPMKEIVEKFGFGVSIDDDGSSVDKMKDGLERLLVNYDNYKENVIKHRHHLVWDQQEPMFRQIIEKLFNDVED